jgi:hypothetical protein
MAETKLNKVALKKEVKVTVYYVVNPSFMKKHDTFQFHSMLSKKIAL